LKALEQLLVNSNGKYCFGDQLTLADAFLVPSVGGSVTRFKIDISKYPRVKSVYENLISL
jgi:glutathione S-transferase